MQYQPWMQWWSWKRRHNIQVLGQYNFQWVATPPSKDCTKRGNWESTTTSHFDSCNYKASSCGCEGRGQCASRRKAPSSCCTVYARALEDRKWEIGRKCFVFTVKIGLQVKLLQAQLNRPGKSESLHCDWYLYRVRILWVLCFPLRLNRVWSACVWRQVANIYRNPFSRSCALPRHLRVNTRTFLFQSKFICICGQILY